MRWMAAAAFVAMAWAGPAMAWPYENYPEPRDFAGYTVLTTLTLPEGKAELLADKRITAANRDKVRAILLGGEAGDARLQQDFDHDDPRWAVVRFTPKQGEQHIMVLDHALASLALDDIQGDGKPKLRVEIDYLEGYRGRLTLFMEPVKGRLEPVQYRDAQDGYRVQIELMDAPKGWWKRSKDGKAAEFLMVDARFDQRVDLMRIAWDGKEWKRFSRMLPGGAVTSAEHFPPRVQFP